MTLKKASGYIRVSTKSQAETGESLATQTQAIKDFAKQRGYKFTKIYSDAGISGGSVKNRHGLQSCLQDGQLGKFDVLIILRLSRFGRNARELLQNHDLLEEIGIELVSIKEGIDFSTKYGKAMLGMFGVMAELEKDIIREQMLENRVAKAKRGIPTSGAYPIGRTFDRNTNQWYLDESIKEMLQWAAEKYLKGGSLRGIVKEINTRFNYSVTYDSLRKTLKNKCGDKWTVNFTGGRITYQVPSILSKETIEQIHERLEFNSTSKRTNIKGKYLLSGFIYCEKCKKTLVGQQYQQGRYKYYRHSNKEGGKGCKPLPFNQINAFKIEEAVFQAVFENIVDAPIFEAAIAESIPDERAMNNLEVEVEIEKSRNALKQINRELDKLVDIAVKGTLRPETIRNRESELINQSIVLKKILATKKERNKNMQVFKKAKQDTYKKRCKLRRNMSFDKKRELLHWLFDGQNSNGDKYGIYVNKRGEGEDEEIDYFLFGRVTGLRTIKGDDYNYFPSSRDYIRKRLVPNSKVD